MTKVGQTTNMCTGPMQDMVPKLPVFKWICCVLLYPDQGNTHKRISHPWIVERNGSAKGPIPRQKMVGRMARPGFTPIIAKFFAMFWAHAWFSAFGRKKAGCYGLHNEITDTKENYLFPVRSKKWFLSNNKNMTFNLQTTWMVRIYLMRRNPTVMVSHTGNIEPNRPCRALWAELATQINPEVSIRFCHWVSCCWRWDIRRGLRISSEPPPHTDYYPGRTFLWSLIPSFVPFPRISLLIVWEKMQGFGHQHGPKSHNLHHKRVTMNILVWNWSWSPKNQIWPSTIAPEQFLELHLIWFCLELDACMMWLGVAGQGVRHPGSAYRFWCLQCLTLYTLTFLVRQLQSLSIHTQFSRLYQDPKLLWRAIMLDPCREHGGWN